MKLLLKFSPIVLIAFLFLAFFLNPNKNNHIDAIFDAKLKLDPEKKVPSKILKGIKKIISSKPIRKIKAALVNYHDYYLFSYTESKFGNKKLTFGFCGFVFLF